MKGVFAGLLGMVVSLGLVASTHAADSTTIDLKDPLPPKLELSEGDSVVFENGRAQVAARETDGKGTLLESRRHDTFKQNGAFRAVRAGIGEITVTFPRQGLATVIKKKTIVVTVKAAPVVHKVEFKKPYPASVTVKQGETIILFLAFKGDPGLYDPHVTPQVKTTDGKTGDVFATKTPVKRLDKDNIQIREFNALRAGDAEILITDIHGKTVDTIKVLVK